MLAYSGLRSRCSSGRHKFQFSVTDGRTARGYTQVHQVQPWPFVRLNRGRVFGLAGAFVVHPLGGGRRYGYRPVFAVCVEHTHLFGGVEINGRHAGLAGIGKIPILAVVTRPQRCSTPGRNTPAWNNRIWWRLRPLPHRGRFVRRHRIVFLKAGSQRHGHHQAKQDMWDAFHFFFWDHAKYNLRPQPRYAPMPKRWSRRPTCVYAAVNGTALDQVTHVQHVFCRIRKFRGIFLKKVFVRLKSNVWEVLYVALYGFVGVARVQERLASVAI